MGQGVGKRFGGRTRRGKRGSGIDPKSAAGLQLLLQHEGHN